MTNNYINVVKEFCLKRYLFLLFCLSFALWIFSFRGFLAGELTLTGDAIAYFEHMKFYLDQISRLVYPLWDFTRNWGVPVELFLRRIGSFNPLFFLIIFLDKLGLAYETSYLLFLAGYYFLGMVGFYLLAKRFFNNTSAAFSAYLLLMFSSLGTKIFDSYIILTFVPTVWFFFFLVAFVQAQEKRFFLGITFTTMILLTTYIPFYFLTIFLFFIFCFKNN